MKIALICHYYNKRGGIERCISELSEKFITDHEVHVFCHEWKDVSDQRIIFHKVPVLKKPWLLFLVSFFLMSKRVINRVQREGKFDIVHIHVPTASKGDVVTAHSVHIAGMQIMDKDKGRLTKIWQKIRHFDLLLFYLSKFNFLKKRFRKIIAISHSVKSDLEEVIGCPSNAITVIYNGVNLKKHSIKEIDKNTIKKDLGLAESETVFLFVGNEFKRKGLLYLLIALSKIDGKCHPFKLLIAGESSDSSFKSVEVKRIAQSLGIDRKIIFLGKVSNIEQYFSVSDLFILPTQYEPFGLVIAEAMAAGLPVIVSRIAGASELITDNIDGLLLNDPSDATEIKYKIETLLNNPDKMREIGKSARKTIEKYSWDRIAGETLFLYRTLIKTK